MCNEKHCQQGLCSLNTVSIRPSNNKLFFFPNDRDITKTNLLLHFFLIFQDAVENRKRVGGVGKRFELYFAFICPQISFHHFGGEHELPAGLCDTSAF